MCQLLDIDQSRTTPYHPQSDGFVERMNRTIEAMISMFVSPSQRDWDEVLPYIMMAYRSAVQSTTGYSPNYMMLGREVELPIDLIIGMPEEETGTSSTEYVTKLRDQMEEVHALAREHIKWKSNVQKRNYDVKAKPERYEAGDMVRMHNPARKKGISPKLSRPWVGPCLITHRLSNVTYRLQVGPRAKLKVVHFDRLKPYKGTDTPEWIHNELEKKKKAKSEQEMNAAMLDETLTYDYDKEQIQELDFKDNTIDYDIEGDKNEPTNEVTILNNQKPDSCDKDVEIGTDLRRSRRTIKKPERYRE